MQRGVRSGRRSVFHDEPELLAAAELLRDVQGGDFPVADDVPLEHRPVGGEDHALALAGEPQEVAVVDAVLVEGVRSRPPEASGRARPAWRRKRTPSVVVPRPRSLRVGAAAVGRTPAPWLTRRVPKHTRRQAFLPAETRKPGGGYYAATGAISGPAVTSRIRIGP